MGQSLKKLTPGTEEKKIKEIGPIIESCYDTHFTNGSVMTFIEFYRGVCLTVEKINSQLGNTQFKLPKEEQLMSAYNKHHRGKGKALTKSEFEEIMKEVITGAEFTGIGAKEALIYIFGVPVVTLFLKQKLMPQAIRDEFFIPGITSITVLVLAGLNKI